MNKLGGIFSEEEYTSIMDSIYKTASRNAVKFRERFPDLVAENGIYRYFDDFYDACHGGWWTDIFYMLYGYSGDKKLLHYADILTGNFYELVKTKRIYHREMGFIYQPICINDMRYNNSPKAGEILLLASDYMIERFSPALHNPDGNSYEINIIKSSFFINLLLLHAANKISGLSKYADVADRLEKRVFDAVVNDDGSCNMEILKNEEKIRTLIPDDEYLTKYTGGVLSRRGHAWMLLGNAAYYSYKKDSKYLEYFDLIISNLLNDSPANKNKETMVFNVDTTSLSILCCALAELLKKLPQTHEKFELYKNILKNNMRHMADGYFIDASSGKEAFLDGGKFIKNNTKTEMLNGLKPTVCGDYHFLLALMHMNENFVSCWNIDYLP